MKQSSLWRSQNFLKNKYIVNRLINRSGINTEDTVLDLGAGHGELTVPLAQKAQKIIAIELDTSVFRALEENSRAHSNIQTMLLDIRKFRLPQIPYKVFSNIPFYLTAEIVNKLCNDRNFQGGCLIMQKEAASKFTGDLMESVLSIKYKNLFNIKIIHNFRSFDFKPMPKVNIACLEFTRRPEPLVENVLDYNQFVLNAFNSPTSKLNSKIFKVTGKKLTPSEVDHESWVKIYKNMT